MILGSAAMARARPIVLHPARELCRKQICNLVCSDRRGAAFQLQSRGPRLWTFQSAAQQPKATFCQTGASQTERRLGTTCQTERNASRSPSVASAPSIRIVPWSGVTSPSTHFNKTDLPVPDPPMITVELPWGQPVSRRTRRAWIRKIFAGLRCRSCVEEHLCQDVVAGQYQDAGRHHRISGCRPALSPLAGIHSVIAPHQRHEEPKDRAFDKA